MLEEGGDMVEITEQLLDVSKASAAVGDDGAGAISLFVGTTRDNFEGTCSQLDRRGRKPHHACLCMAR